MTFDGRETAGLTPPGLAESRQVVRRISRVGRITSAPSFQLGGGGPHPTPTLHFRVGTLKEADPFIQRHYLRRRPSVVRLCLIAEYAGKPVGCLTFSEAPKQTSIRYKCRVLELSRLFLEDDVPKNGESNFIAYGMRYVRKNLPEIHGIVTYADPSVGHTGAIYKATNFTPDGRTDDERKSPRCDYRDPKTGKMYSRKAHAIKAGVKVVLHPRISKFRFIYRFNRKN